MFIDDPTQLHQLLEKYGVVNVLEEIAAHYAELQDTDVRYYTGFTAQTVRDAAETIQNVLGDELYEPDATTTSSEVCTKSERIGTDQPCGKCHEPGCRYCYPPFSPCGKPECPQCGKAPE